MPVKRRVKIICTLGPASNSRETITNLVNAGMDVARLNFSHGTYRYHADLVKKIRAVSVETGKHIAIIQDLQGPKIRVGQFRNGETLLKKGQTFKITNRDIPGSDDIVSTTYQYLPRDVSAGDDLLLDDGLLSLKVVSKTRTTVETRVVIGGVLKNNKGINLPSTRISAPSLTEKDKKDLAFGLSQGVDFVALSFVRSAKDIVDIKKRISAAGVEVPVIAKIEKPEAVTLIDEIIDAADAVMVARGDLGVELPTEQVPPLQKRVISKCNAAGVPVITATQMLDSMINNPRPTRAEASDVANAVLDGSDAVMLSGETASGKYPVKAVRVMNRIISMMEQEDRFEFSRLRRLRGFVYPVPEVVCMNACLSAENVGARAIVAITALGSSARLIAKYRPRKEIIAFTHKLETVRQLRLVWGIDPIYVPDFKDNIENALKRIKNLLRKERQYKKGELVLITLGSPFKKRGITNTLRIESV